ncbi:MAG: hypothetical protein ACLFRG_14305 [Desulfococcaceae bacterium]
MAWVRRRGMAVCLLCCFLVAFGPVNANALGLGLSFDVLSIGPFSLGLDLLSIGGGGAAAGAGLGILGLLGGALLAGAFFAFFSGTGHASYSGPAPPVITHLRVTIDPEGHYPGRPLEMKFHDVIHDGRLELPGPAYLEVMDDGKMVFRDSLFEGHVLLHFDRSLSVWDADGDLACVLTVNENRLLVLQEKSDRATLAVAVLFGGVE